MRRYILEKLYEWSLIPYQAFKKNKGWDIGIEELIQFPKASLGERMSHFLTSNNFGLQDKLESHDVFHVLTGIGISVPEEISMQYYLLGNGKRSIYLFSVILIGGLMFPDYFKMFLKNYRLGKASLAFHQLDFEKLLHQPVDRIKSTFSIQQILL